MSTIYLVRHAQYANPRDILPGRLPVELSEEGLQEAQRLQKFFKDKNITKIFSSAVHRCKQTSEAISNKNIPIEFDKRLLESFSAYQGYWINDPSHFFEHNEELGGESYQDIQNRMISFWNEKIIKTQENILICSHGDPLYFFYCWLMKINLPTDPAVEKTMIEQSDYQTKGSIRPVILGNDGNIQVEKLITQKDLLYLLS